MAAGSWNPYPASKAREVVKVGARLGTEGREWGFSSGSPSFCLSPGIGFLQETIRGLWKKYTQNLATGRGNKALGGVGGLQRGRLVLGKGRLRRDPAPLPPSEAQLRWTRHWTRTQAHRCGAGAGDRRPATRRLGSRPPPPAIWTRATPPPHPSSFRPGVGNGGGAAVWVGLGA